YTSRYLTHFRNHFSTIGVNGMNEMVRNFTGDRHDLTDNFGHDMAIEILDHIRKRLKTFQEDTGNLYNLEATSAEGTTYRFAKEDLMSNYNIKHVSQHETFYYTNSSQLTADYTEDLF